MLACLIQLNSEDFLSCLQYVSLYETYSCLFDVEVATASISLAIILH